MKWEGPLPPGPLPQRQEVPRSTGSGAQGARLGLVSVRRSEFPCGKVRPSRPAWSVQVAAVMGVLQRQEAGEETGEENWPPRESVGHGGAGVLSRAFHCPGRGLKWDCSESG